jgi:multiple sugar transport system substrate-binding protein
MKHLLVIMLLFLFACKPPHPGKVVIKILTEPDRGGGWKALIAEFEKTHPDIKVERHEGRPETDAREEAYVKDFRAGAGTYDIVYMDIIWVPKFAHAGWIIPLDDRFTKQMQKEFLPKDIAGSIYRGKIYRVPMRSDAGMLYYRKDLVKKPPRTFKELRQICMQLKKEGKLHGFVFQGKQYEGLVCAFLEVLWGFGGEFIDKNGNVVIDSPEAIEALEWLCGMVKDGLSPPGVTTYQEEECRHIFQQGRAVFMRNWPYAWTLLQTEKGSVVKGKVGIIPMVCKEGKKSAATLGGWGFGISKYSKHKDAAWKFIEFATSEKGQKIFHFKNGAVVTRRSLYEDEEILKESPHYPQLYKILLNARPRPAHPKYYDISRILQVYLSKALVGKMSPKDALKEAAVEIRKILEK